MDEQTEIKQIEKINEYERAFIGSILVDERKEQPKDRAGALNIAKSELRPEDLWNSVYRWIYQACLDLKKEDTPINEISLEKKLEEYKDCQVSITDIIDVSNALLDTPTQANVAYYVREIAKDVVSRKERKALEEAIEKGESLYEGLRIFHEDYERIEKIGKPIPTMKDELPALYSQIIDDPEMPLATFSDTLNWNLNGGLMRGKVFTITAPAGWGKTTFALQLLEEVAKTHKVPCVFIAMEMSKKELLIKTLSRLGEINSGFIEGKKWKKGVKTDYDCFDKIMGAVNIYRDFYAPYFYMIEGGSGLTVSQIEDQIRRIRTQVKKESGKDLPLVLCIDPFQRLSSGDPGRDKEEITKVGDVASQLKRLARDLNISVILLSDTTKEATKRAEEGRHIGQTGIRYSYMATHTTDIQAELRIGRDLPDQLLKEMENEEAKQKLERIFEKYSLTDKKYSGISYPTYACLEFSKQRSGALNRCLFIYQKAFNKFIPLEYEQIDIEYEEENLGWDR